MGIWELKKFFIVILVSIILTNCVAFTACDLFVGSSSAVTYDELLRENYAAEKEAEDDAKGRDHIEIPTDAQTVELENEEWVVLRNMEDFRHIWSPIGGTANRDQNLKKNYIVANDIDLKGWEYGLFNQSFEGKFNGNNYKFYSQLESGGFISCLFYRLENALVENIIFSSEGYYHGTPTSEENVLIAALAINSSVKNCVNYFQTTSSQNTYIASGALIARASNCIIENCVNYGDNSNSNGGIVGRASECTIRNCKNYGNLVCGVYTLGGIVSVLQDDNIIENCENYGHIVGKSRLGGIVGSVWQGISKNSCSYSPEGLDEKYYTENQLIKGCVNYGSIYLLKETGDKRIETTDRDSELEYKDIIYEIGGIAGSVTKIENCINKGNFYGFENMGGNIKVDCLGGIVGITKEIKNCENKGEMTLQKGRTIRVGNIYGYLDN